MSVVVAFSVIMTIGVFKYGCIGDGIYSSCGVVWNTAMLIVVINQYRYSKWLRNEVEKSKNSAR